MHLMLVYPNDYLAKKDFKTTSHVVAEGDTVKATTVKEVEEGVYARSYRFVDLVSLMYGAQLNEDVFQKLSTDVPIMNMPVPRKREAESYSHWGIHE